MGATRSYPYPQLGVYVTFPVSFWEPMLLVSLDIILFNSQELTIFAPSVMYNIYSGISGYHEHPFFWASLRYFSSVSYCLWPRCLRWRELATCLRLEFLSVPLCFPFIIILIWIQIHLSTATFETPSFIRHISLRYKFSALSFSRVWLRSYTKAD